MKTILLAFGFLLVAGTAEANQGQVPDFSPTARAPAIPGKPLFQPGSFGNGMNLAQEGEGRREELRERLEREREIRRIERERFERAEHERLERIERERVRELERERREREREFEGRGEGRR